MQFALRQGFKVGPAVVLWILISALCALSGPFGTLDAMDFWARLAYWTALVGVSVWASLRIDRLTLQRSWQKVAVWGGFAVMIAAAVYLLNTLIFGDTAGTGNFFHLIAIVAATVLVVHGMLWLAFRYVPGTAPPPVAPTDIAASDIAARFQRRLPLEVRGPLVRIEAQDHYLNVVTTNGSALILLRLTEAIEELAGAEGVQTHRSHWVALDAVRSHRRVEGRDVLLMSDETEVPVARTRRDVVKEAGLF